MKNSKTLYTKVFKVADCKSAIKD